MPPDLILEALTSWQKSVQQHYASHWLLGPGLARADEAEPQGSPLSPRHFVPILDDHSHPFSELFVCVRGEGRLILEGRTYEVCGGDVAVILPDQQHWERPKVGSDYAALWMGISTQRTHVHLLTAGPQETWTGLQSQTLQPASWFFQRMEDLRKVFETPSVWNEDLAKGSVVEFLAMAGRCLSEQNGRGVTDWKESLVKTIDAYVAGHLSQQLRLEDLSRVVSVSPNHLNAVFRTLAGKPLIQYIHEKKLAQARDWLSSSPLSIADIAQRLGYYDGYHFSRSFKKEVGVSPSDFRRQSLNPPSSS